MIYNSRNSTSLTSEYSWKNGYWIKKAQTIWNVITRLLTVKERLTITLREVPYRLKILTRRLQESISARYVEKSKILVYIHSIFYVFVISWRDSWLLSTNFSRFLQKQTLVDLPRGIRAALKISNLNFL